MAKILFSTAPVSLEERYGTLSGAGNSMPSLGLLFLAAVARKAGHECHVMEPLALNMPMGECVKRISSIKPDILALTACTMSVHHAGLLAAEAKKLNPEILTILGGPHSTAVPAETMNMFPDIDIIVVGEGEATFSELLSALAENKDLSVVKGIFYREGAGLKSTSSRPFLENLDTIPFPAWDLLEGFPARYSPPAFKIKNVPAASLVTSRGCPDKCTFCDRSVFGTRYRFNSAEYVTDMILELYRRYGVREISFEDDTFLAHRPRLFKICEKIRALGLDLSWSCLGRVNQVNDEVASALKKAGCWQISWGIESGSQEILNNICKNATLEQIRNALAITHKHGIVNKGFFIVGNPGETQGTLEETLKFALELPLDDISVMMFTPFPGTEVFKYADSLGVFDRDWKKMNLLNPVFIPNGFTKELLLAEQKKILRRFYFRPSVALSYLSRMKNRPAIAGAVWSAFKAFLKSV